MRSALWGIVVASSSLTGWLWLGSGCGLLPLDCKELYNCPPGAGGGSATASSATSSSTGGGPPLTCIPTAGKDPVADTCGVFVSSSLGDDAAGLGTKAKPYKTLAAAISAASKLSKPVYACAETFTETLTVSDGVGLYGGLDCKKSWGYTGDVKSTLTAGADSVPLTLSKTANGAALFDFEVVAVDAVIAGGSSIAVIADQVTAAFTRCDLTAGNGKDGLAGVMSTDGVGPTSDAKDPSIRGNDGANACPAMGTTQLGGEAKDNMFCPNASGGPIGGAGGTGSLTTAGNGGAVPANAQTAFGGAGQTSDPMWSCASGFGQADTGVNGQPGLDGAGATGMASLGKLSSSGYAGVPGMPGDLGKPGQGGGGGGGAKGKVACAGASGGGGGAGGCGGHGGTGGSAGGASVALVSLEATLSFASVTVAPGSGGVGGDGGQGQFGGVGGIAGFGGSGNGTLSACDGGHGGTGGIGGKGGGGRGGHAIGIAATGMAPDTKGVTFSPKGTAGLGGKGGPSQDGDPGVQVNVQPFP